MSPDLSRRFNSKKFMWDGIVYQEVEKAEAAAEAYRGDGVEVKMVVEGDRRLVYTRRTASGESHG